MGRVKLNHLTGRIEKVPEMETIGAHFSAIIETRSNAAPGNYGYESARSALYTLLKEVRPARVHIPNYICEAISDAIDALGTKTVKYAINREFCIDGKLDLQNGDLVLLVDYYGLTQESVHADLDGLPSASVIVDCSQAYFQKPFDCLASIYSARKFIPVPDGGFVNTNVDLTSEQPDEDASIHRSQYLMKRVVGEPELSRDLYVEAEQSLSEASSRAISAFSEKIIETTDLDYIQHKRKANFDALGSLASINKLQLTHQDQVPLCYPLMIDAGSELREYLKQKRVFTPVYWPNVIPLNDFEKALLKNVVYLPIDHRYGASHMKYLNRVIMDFINQDSQ